MTESSYKIKRVSFLGRDGVPIFCQSENGPCPLLAVANVLSLRNALHVPQSMSEIQPSRLTDMVGESILEQASKLEQTPGAPAANLWATVHDCLEVLKCFNRGVDVNIKFDNPLGFEPTPEVAVFDLLGIHLVHGWLVDPQDTEAARALSNKSYNQAVELMIAGLEPGTTTPHTASKTRSFSHRVSSTPAAAATAAATDTVAPGPSQPAPTAAAGGEADLLGLLDGPSNPGLDAAVVPVQPSTSAAPDVLDLLMDATPVPATEQAPAVEGDPADKPTAAYPETVPPAVAAPEPETTSLGADAAPLASQPRPAEAVTEQAALPATDADDLFSGLSLADAPSLAPAPALPVEAAPQPPSALCPHPSDGDLAAAGGSSTLLTGSASVGGSFVQRTHDALVVKAFLDSNPSQLTVYGIAQIATSLQELTLAVFFRNNHFNCLFKHGESLFLLITDQGYLNVPEVVWERLDTVDGDTQLCGPDFLAHKARAQQAPRRDVDMAALAAIPPEALAGLSEADAAAIAEAAGLLVPPRDSSRGGGDHTLQDPQHMQLVPVGGPEGTYQPPPMHWGEPGPPGAHYDHQHGGMAPHAPHGGSEDADLALAMALQEEEEAHARREAREREARQAAARQGAPTPPPPQRTSWGGAGAGRPSPPRPPPPQSAAAPAAEEKSSCSIQ